MTLSRLTMIALCLALPSLVSAQSNDSATLKALLEEVQKLRMALEKSSVVVPRAQLTMQRMALQEQRVAKAEQQLDAVRKELAADVERRQHLTGQLEEATRRLATATDPAERRELEAMQAGTRKFLSDQTAQVELRGREATLASNLQREQADLAELSNRLNTLERSLSQ